MADFKVNKNKTKAGGVDAHIYVAVSKALKKKFFFSVSLLLTEYSLHLQFLGKGIGLVLQESTTVTTAAFAGISLSTVLNVQVLFQLTMFCSCIKEV